MSTPLPPLQWLLLRPPSRKSLPSWPSSVSSPASPKARSSPTPQVRRSWPSPPCSSSLPAAPSRTSSPVPPNRMSLPSSPNSWSWPPPPETTSLPAPAWMMSSPSPPLMMSSPPPPLMVSCPPNARMQSRPAVPFRVSLLEVPRMMVVPAGQQVDRRRDHHHPLRGGDGLPGRRGPPPSDHGQAVGEACRRVVGDRDRLARRAGPRRADVHRPTRRAGDVGRNEGERRRRVHDRDHHAVRAGRVVEIPDGQRDGVDA